LLICSKDLDSEQQRVLRDTINNDWQDNRNWELGTVATTVTTAVQPVQPYCLNLASLCGSLSIAFKLVGHRTAYHKTTDEVRSGICQEVCVQSSVQVAVCIVGPSERIIYLQRLTMK
jgi:Flp pilus assembly protein CpaB